MEMKMEKNRWQKAKQTIEEKYGKDYYRRIGKKGGSVCGEKGFAVNPELAKAAGIKSGEVRRAKSDSAAESYDE